MLLYKSTLLRLYTTTFIDSQNCNSPTPNFRANIIKISDLRNSYKLHWFALKILSIPSIAHIFNGRPLMPLHFKWI